LLRLNLIGDGCSRRQESVGFLRLGSLRAKRQLEDSAALQERKKQKRSDDHIQPDSRRLRVSGLLRLGPGQLFVTAPADGAILGVVSIAVWAIHLFCSSSGLRQPWCILISPVDYSIASYGGQLIGSARDDLNPLSSRESPPSRSHNHPGRVPRNGFYAGQCDAPERQC